MTTLRPEWIEAAASALDRVVPNSDGVLWDYDEIADEETGQTMKRPVTPHDAARAALSAALPLIEESNENP